MTNLVLIKLSEALIPCRTKIHKCNIRKYDLIGLYVDEKKANFGCPENFSPLPSPQIVKKYVNNSRRMWKIRIFI